MKSLTEIETKLAIIDNSTNQVEERFSDIEDRNLEMTQREEEGDLR